MIYIYILYVYIYLMGKSRVSSIFPPIQLEVSNYQWHHSNRSHWEMWKIPIAILMGYILYTYGYSPTEKINRSKVI